jgi:hypothetical protein
MKHWWERRSGRWDSFHTNKRWSYYMFLRAVYGLNATEAWGRANIPHEKPPTQYECPECDWCGTEDEVNSVDDIHDCVATGEFMAPGECPDCGALIGVADEDIPNYTIEPAIDIALARGLLRNLGKLP